MPNLITQHFEPLCAFLIPLLLQLSAPHQRHALNVVGALPVCGSTHKTLTTLTAMLRLPHADHFALADFLPAERVVSCGRAPGAASCRGVDDPDGYAGAGVADQRGGSVAVVSERGRLTASSSPW